MKSNRYAGQYKMRGKKYRRLGCGCCEIQDFRGSYVWRCAGNAIRRFLGVGE